jgi:hypothetical protein
MIVPFHCVREGVPIYVHWRVAAYARWNPVRVTVWTLAQWQGLGIEREIEVWHNLVRWEHAHPALRGRT